MAADLLQITTLKEHAPAGYEWEAVAQMHLLWGKLWRTGMLTPAPDRQTATQGDLAKLLFQIFCRKIWMYPAGIPQTKYCL